MIVYNMRYRGPYEYEKFVLNILQYKNIIDDIANDMNDVELWTTLKELNNNVDSIFNKVIGDNGLSEKIYKYLIMIDRRV